MTWFKIDDKFHDHRKPRRAGKAAIGVWALAGSWSADNLEDGFVPAAVLPRWGDESDAAALVEAGLWTVGERDGEPGWWFHQWEERQPMREAVEEERRKARERMANLRRGSGARSASVRPNGERTSDAVTQPRPDPTRPDPTKSSANSLDAAVAAEFEAFWDLYPRKADRARASKAYAKARRTTPADKILTGLQRQLPWFAAQVKPEGDFRPHAATWLNGERWGDAPVLPMARPAQRLDLPEAWR